MNVVFFSLKAHVRKTFKPAALAAVMALRTSGGELIKGNQYALLPANMNGLPSIMNLVPSVYGTPFGHFLGPYVAGADEAMVSPARHARNATRRRFMLAVTTLVVVNPAWT